MCYKSNDSTEKKTHDILVISDIKDIGLLDAAMIDCNPFIFNIKNSLL